MCVDSLQTSIQMLLRTRRGFAVKNSGSKLHTIHYSSSSARPSTCSSVRLRVNPIPKHAKRHLCTSFEKIPDLARHTPMASVAVIASFSHSESQIRRMLRFQRANTTLSASPEQLAGFFSFAGKISFETPAAPLFVFASSLCLLNKYFLLFHHLDERCVWVHMFGLHCNGQR